MLQGKAHIVLGLDRAQHFEALCDDFGTHAVPGQHSNTVVHGDALLRAFLYETTASLAWRMKAWSLRQSFVPGVASTPLQTSTAYGRTIRMASRTFSGVSPPAKMMRP